jgi:arginine deiminase
MSEDIAGPTPAAFGGPQWRPRPGRLRDEIGALWGSFGSESEWTPLRSVLLHPPGPEFQVSDPEAALMLERPDLKGARSEHRALVQAYEGEGVEVHYVDPDGSPPGPFPNLIYVADLLFMTPEGAILARPAGAARAGEERWVQRRLAELGIPILRAISGSGTFEGADAMWLDPATVLVGPGFRTNREGVRQVRRVLEDLGVDTLLAEVPSASMHLMGQLRIVDRDLAFYRKGRLPDSAVAALEARGFSLHSFPDPLEMDAGYANNIVTLGPRRILMPAGAPTTRSFFGDHGVECVTVSLQEIHKGAGSVGCLTGVLRRGG